MPLVRAVCILVASDCNCPGSKIKIWWLQVQTDNIQRHSSNCKSNILLYWKGITIGTTLARWMSHYDHQEVWLCDGTDSKSPLLPSNPRRREILIALIFENWTPFAPVVIYINMGCSSSKQMHKTSPLWFTKYKQKKKVYLTMTPSQNVSICVSIWASCWLYTC